MKKLSYLLLMFAFVMVNTGCEKNELQEDNFSDALYDESNIPTTNWEDFPEELKNAQSIDELNTKAAYYKYKLGPWGGNGGNYFSYLPPSNSKIYAIAIRSGRYIDRIAVYYKLSDGRIVKGVDKGGNGGNYHLHFFSDNEYIRKVSGRTGRLVDQLTIYTNHKHFTHGGKGGNPFTASIGKNYQILGFFGRTGRLLDQIGFYVYSK